MELLLRKVVGWMLDAHRLTVMPEELREAGCPSSPCGEDRPERSRSLSWSFRARLGDPDERVLRGESLLFLLLHSPSRDLQLL